ncbi:hypothetical protein HQ964_10495 [Enterococcus faecium]|nr:hypothetical protein [Enterococcus faecium]EJB5628310.1 hypothetical protein [Enterococcus faecium]EKZ0430139.1 hypothetical protein [Enterococcus faecium]EME3554894.1 hypothetical protein [Enterococcus faecium]NTK10011.1 hypothetical protein [Enterococcus faecium]NTM67322.1 hypothetical protein [Enterococcus faecium]
MFIAPFHSYFSTLALLAEVAKIKIEELVLLKQKKHEDPEDLVRTFSVCC